MAGHYDRGSNGFSNRKALQDRKTRERVGEATWQKWQRDAAADNSFLSFGIGLVVVLGVIFFWLMR